MLPQRVWFLCRFGLKTGMDFAYLVWIQVWFLRVYWSAWTYLSFQFQMNMKERVVRKFEMDFKKYFCPNLSNDEIISAYMPGLKWVWKMTFFGLK